MNTLMPVTRLLDAALNGGFDACRTEQTNARHTPRADVLEGEKEYQILMDMPGVRNEDLDISLENQSLTVKAERSSDAPAGFELRRHERPGPVSFSRSFNLGSAVDSGNIAAQLDQGVLRITLPKSEKSLPRRIEVK